jgi:hypothetical protein
LAKVVFSCDFCDRIVSEGDLKCPKCNFPIAGTHEQKDKFLQYHQNISEQKKRFKLGVRTAIYVLIVLGLVKTFVNVSLLLGFGYFRKIQLESFLLSGITESIIEGVAYIALGLGAFRKPFPFLILGLIIFVFFQIIEGDFHTMSSILLRGLAVLILVRGIIFAKKYTHEPKNNTDEILHDEV